MTSRTLILGIETSCDETAAAVASFGTFNSQRLPTYHRLDITVKHSIITKKKNNLEIVLGVTNAYNRNNIFYVNRITNEIIYQFPVLPSLGISYKF